MISKLWRLAQSLKKTGLERKLALKERNAIIAKPQIMLCSAIILIAGYTRIFTAR